MTSKGFKDYSGFEPKSEKKSKGKLGNLGFLPPCQHWGAEEIFEFLVFSFGNTSQQTIDTF